MTVPLLTAHALSPLSLESDNTSLIRIRMGRSLVTFDIALVKLDDRIVSKLDLREFCCLGLVHQCILADLCEILVVVF